MASGNEKGDVENLVKRSQRTYLTPVPEVTGIAGELAQKLEARHEALTRLRDALDLPGIPLRIECYDISNLGETNAVGSMVVFDGSHGSPS